MHGMLDGVIPPLLVVGVALLAMATRQAYVNVHGRRAVLADIVVVAIVVSYAGYMELQMGRTPAYEHGPVRLWSGQIHSDQNSQQVLDPYSLTHVVHGAAFYGLARVVMRSAPLGPIAVAALTLEATWEVYENTDQVISRYRAVTISRGYYGDSLINSMADILACASGLLLAWRLPRWVTMIWVVGFEVLLAFWIRDNLTLNIIMLIHPFKAIGTWQGG